MAWVAPTAMQLGSTIPKVDSRLSLAATDLVDASCPALTPYSRLRDLLDYADVIPDMREVSAEELPGWDRSLDRPLVEFCDCNGALHKSRPAFLLLLKRLGLKSVADRQKVANALGALLRKFFAAGAPGAPHECSDDCVGHARKARETSSPLLAQSGPRLLPGDAALWFTPFNWLVSADVLDGEPGAVSQTPGAYFRVEWEGVASKPLTLEVDTSAMDMACMSIAYSLDGAELEVLVLPHGKRRARLDLPVPDATFGAQEVRRHRLFVSIYNSRQKVDRWGAKGTLPQSALRLRAVLLPPGATVLQPQLRPRRILAFGDSIVEGVCACAERTEEHSKISDLDANSSSKTWVAEVADHFDAEYSSVGYGRHGYTLSANGNVPPFAPLRPHDECSWDKLWADTPRSFSHGAGEQLDMVFLTHGTCDGLILGQKCANDLELAVRQLLPRLRAAVGPAPSVFLCVPFGGFGGERQQPFNSLRYAFDDYMSASRDPTCHFVSFEEDASRNLTGYQFDESGRFATTADSFDGVHPLAARQQELGRMVVSQVEKLRMPATGSVLSDSEDVDYWAILEEEPHPDLMEDLVVF